jgi:hypothetical protein
MQEDPDEPCTGVLLLALVCHSSQTWGLGFTEGELPAKRVEIEVTMAFGILDFQHSEIVYPEHLSYRSAPQSKGNIRQRNNSPVKALRSPATWEALEGSWRQDFCKLLWACVSFSIECLEIIFREMLVQCCLRWLSSWLTRKDTQTSCESEHSHTHHGFLPFICCINLSSVESPKAICGFSYLIYRAISKVPALCRCQVTEMSPKPFPCGSWELVGHCTPRWKALL